MTPRIGSQSRMLASLVLVVWSSVGCALASGTLPSQSCHSSSEARLPDASESYDPNTIAEVYQGQTVTIASGFSDAAGTNDLPTKMISRYLGRHLPGQPEVVLYNNAGSRWAAQDLAK